MAAPVNFLRSLKPCQPCSSQVPPLSMLVSCVGVRRNSNTASITRTRRMCYPRTYPTLLVFPDGSTINIRYKEPRRLIKLPLDFSSLSEAEKNKVLAKRKPVQKLEVTEEFEDDFDVSKYQKFFKK